MTPLERTLIWIIRGALFLILFTPLIVSQRLFFPFITGKNFYFRILVEIAFGAWIALVLLTKEFRVRRSLLLWTFLAFVGAVTLATLFGVAPYHSFWSNFERMEGLVTQLHLLAFFLIAAHIFRSKKDWLYFFSVSTGVSIIAAIYGLLQWEGIIGIFGGGRPYATFGNSIYLAVYLLFHMFIVAIFFSEAKKQSFKIFYGLLFVLEFLAFLVAGSRGAFAGFIIAVVFAALIFVIRSHSRLVQFGSALALVFIVFLLGYIRLNPQSSFVQKNQIFNRISTMSVENFLNDSRVLIWRIAWKGFLDRPLLGWGPENFIIVYAKHYDANLFSSEAWFDRAHNMFLEWLVDTGAIGFLAYLVMFASAFYLIVALTKSGKLNFYSGTLLVSLFIAYLIQNFFVFDNVTTYIILFSVFAFLHSLFVSPPAAAATRNKPSSSFVALSGGAIVITLFLIYFLNVKQLLAANQLIVALEGLGHKTSVDSVIEDFNKVTAYDTFGSTEARERLADAVVQVAGTSTKLGPPYVTLLNKAIEELEKETKAQPMVSKYYVFLGKLYTIKVNMTGSGVEEAEKNYTKARELSPNYIQIYLGFAELYIAAGKGGKAAEYAHKAFALPDKLSTKGALFFPVLSIDVLTGSFRDAVTLMQNFEKLNGGVIPLNPEADTQDVKLLVARALSTSKNLEDREIFFEELARRVESAHVYVGLAQTYGELHQKAKAREAALHALSLDPSLRDGADKFLKDLEALP